MSGRLAKSTGDPAVDVPGPNALPGREAHSAIPYSGADGAQEAREHDFDRVTGHLPRGRKGVHERASVALHVFWAVSAIYRSRLHGFPAAIETEGHVGGRKTRKRRCRAGLQQRRAMGCLAGASRRVNRAFRSFERFVGRHVDRTTRVLQPVFVAAAISLISLCAFAFFEAVYPEVFLAPDTPWWKWAMGTAWCGYLVVMMVFHYYMAIATHAGSPLDPPRPLSPSQPLPILGPTLLWLTTRLNSSPQAPTRTRSLRQRAVQTIQAAQEREQQLRQAERGATESDRRARPDPPTQKEQSSTRADRYARVCKKCEPTTSGGRPPKPERTHHCSVCATCILKFDHHCPWIKGCVGLHNERYFTLFLCYFSVASLFAAYWGLRPTLRGLSFVRNRWDHLTPRIVMLLSEVLTTIMGFAVLVMCLSQLHLIMRNQTNVESSDNDWYRKVALSRGRTFLNPYDLGWRENFREFFNIGAASEGRYHWLTVFLPLAIPPVSDGWTWRKREDWHDYAMSHEDELTDEEEPDSDEEVEQVAVD